MTDLVVRILAILAGCAIAVQAPVNARLRAAIVDPFAASFVSIAVSAFALAVILIGRRAPLQALALGARDVPWWAWTGGLFGVAYVAISLIVVPRIGAAALVSLVVLGMMFTAMAIDQGGMLNVTLRQLSPLRILGAACVVGGVFLIARY